MKNEPTTRNKI